LAGAQGPTRLFLFGAYEFKDINEPKSLEPSVAQTLGAAYASLGYDAGYVTPDDAKELGDAASAILKERHDNVGTVVSRIVEKEGKRFGLVFMPELPDSGKGPTEGPVDAVMGEAEKLRPQVDMVIGLSL